MEKLRRLPTQDLQRIDDIAGCRITVLDIVEQQRVVSECLQRLDDQGCAVTVKSRLWSEETLDDTGPKYGYRGVHLVAKRDGMRVEIQVRTELQNSWAQIVESLGDAWGRELRYGEPIRDGGQPVVPGGEVTRSGLFERCLDLSRSIEGYEKVALKFDEVDQRFSELEFERSCTPDELLDLSEQRAALRRKLDELKLDIIHMLESWRVFVGRIA